MRASATAMRICVVAGKAPCDLAFCRLRPTVFVAAQPEGTVMDCAARVRRALAFEVVAGADACEALEDDPAMLFVVEGVDDEPPFEQATNAIKRSSGV